MTKNIIKIEMEKMGIMENVIDNIMEFHGVRVTHREFRNGYYVYKNKTNDNGRVIKIKNSPKSITYSIFNYYDNRFRDLSDNDCLVKNKRSFKKDIITLYMTSYDPSCSIFFVEIL
jgi:hypothetical protein